MNLLEWIVSKLKRPPPDASLEAQAEGLDQLQRRADDVRRTYDALGVNLDEQMAEHRAWLEGQRRLILRQAREQSP